MIKKLILMTALLGATAAWAATTLAKETTMVPMRDGIRLATDVYRPNDARSHPVLLHRTPYGKNDLFLPAMAISVLNLKGYVIVMQDTRGRYESQGADSVFMTDGWGAQQDGYDTIEWLVKQPWCNGKVALFGASASGITSYRAIGSLHKAIKAAVVAIAPTDFYRQVVYPGGEYGKELCDGWVNKQGSTYMIDYYLRYPYYSAMWEQMNLHTRTDSIRVPIIHLGGWYDCFSSGPIAAFRDLKRHLDFPQKLIMGPWVHGSTGSADAVGQLTYPDAAFDYTTLAFGWFDHYLFDIANDIEKRPPVHYYLMGDAKQPEDGGCRWLEAETWPPPEAVTQTFYLNANGRLERNKVAEVKEWRYSYDPANPVPTLGGNNLNVKPGPYDQRAIGVRNDVIGFLSDPLTAPLRLEGYVKGVLYISSNQPDTDFTLKLLDVYPDGREMLVVDGIQRARYRTGVTESTVQLLTPNQIEKITVALPPTALIFGKNHRIKAVISSSNHTRFEKNANTSRPPNDYSNPQIATNSLYSGSDFASWIELPVVSSSTLVRNDWAQPEQFTVSSAYPNPFNATTQIRYRLHTTTKVSARIFAVNGTWVRTVVEDILNPGEHTLRWNGVDEYGVAVPTGVYMMRIQTEQWTAHQKMALVR